MGPRCALGLKKRTISGDRAGKTGPKSRKAPKKTEPVAAIEAEALRPNLAKAPKALKSPKYRSQEVCLFPLFVRQSAGGAQAPQLPLQEVYLFPLFTFAAGVVERPEDSPQTSLFERLLHLQEQGVPKEVIQDANADDRTFEGTQAAQEAAKAMIEAERSGWQLPIHDERQYDPNARPGASDRIDPPTYFRLVDALARKAREGKASLDQDVSSIFDRLTMTADGALFWETMKKLERMTLTGAFVRALGSPERIKAAAETIKPDKSKRSWFVVNKKALQPDADAS